MAARTSREDGVEAREVLSRPWVVIWSTVAFVGFLGLWELIVRAELVHRIILPGPGEVGVALWELVTSKAFPGHLRTTMFETAGGFVLGSALGFLLALAVVVSPFLSRMLRPFIVALQVAPKIALAPLLITWFGFGPNSKIAQSVLLTFFPVFINTDVGLSKIDPDGLKMMRSLLASRWEIFSKLRLPSALPATFLGLRVGLTFSLIGAVVAEMIAARSGLGLVLVQSHARFAIDTMYAVIVIMSLIGLVLFVAIAWLDRKVIYWREERSGLL